MRQGLIVIGLVLNTILLTSILVLVAKMHYARSPMYSEPTVPAEDPELLSEVNGIVPACTNL